MSTWLFRLIIQQILNSSNVIRICLHTKLLTINLLQFSFSPCNRECYKYTICWCHFIFLWAYCTTSFKDLTEAVRIHSVIQYISSEYKMAAFVYSDHIPIFRLHTNVNVLFFILLFWWQFHNANQLSAWCLHHICTHYNRICANYRKEIKLKSAGKSISWTIMSPLELHDL